MVITSTSKDELRQLLEKRDAFATTLVVVCVDTYGTECFAWDPDMLLSELEADFNASIPQFNRDKISGLITALTTDSFYRDPAVFWQLANVFSGSSASFNSGIDPMTSDEAAWAAVEVTINDLPDEGAPSPTVHTDVAGMVGVLLHQEGFIRPPQFLKWAEMPELRPAMDPAAEQARYARTDRLEQDLVQMVQARLARLNAELEDVPLSAVTRASSGAVPKDFLRQLTSELAADRPASPTQSLV